MTLVKICGLKTESDVESAIRAGADRIGFVIVPSSPRYVDPDFAADLANAANHPKSNADRPADVWVVAAWSPSGGPHTQGLDDIVRRWSNIAVVQLHGRETPEDVADFRSRVPSHIQVWKAIGVDTREDLDGLAAYDAADGFLLDAKPPAGATREGGFGHAFDWSILHGFDPGKPWALGGGLNPGNVAEAIRISGAYAVDVSSGVEASPGVKDPAKIRDFIRAAKG